MAISNLFNVEWYLRNNPDVAAEVAAGRIDAETHFNLFGQFENRSPSPLFDPAHYLASSPDVADAVARGLTTAYDHFLNFGASEDRSFNTYFDAGFYLQQNPDVADAVAQGLITAAEHFALFGQSEPRAVSPFIDLSAYLTANPDIADAASQGAFSVMDHLLTYGIHEGRDLGNGVSLSQFQNDPVFQQAVSSGGNPFDAMARVTEVTPFLPSFEPPAGWVPPADTPIPLDFVPTSGTQLVIPPSVTVPDDVELPDTFVPPAPSPEPPVPGGGGGGGGTPPPTFTVDVNADRVVTFGGTANADVTISLSDGKLTFTSGTMSIDIDGDLSDISFAKSADIGRIVAKDAQVVLKHVGGDDTLYKISLHESIMSAIDAAHADDEIRVGAGTWKEQVILDKSGLKLLGPNINVETDGARKPEAVLQWYTTSSYSSVITSNPDAVGSVIAGFTVKGNTSDVTQTGVLISSDDTDFTHNIVQDFGYIGIRVNHFTYDSETKKWTIHLVEGVEVADNKIFNIYRSTDEESVGHGVYVQGAIADVVNNTILDTYTGIQIQPYGINYNNDLYSDATHTDPSVRGNSIESVHRGIWLNYAQTGAPKWKIENNDISAVGHGDRHATPDSWQGIWVQNYQGGGGFVIQNNEIDGGSAEIPRVFDMRLTGIDKENPNLLVVGPGGHSIYNEIPKGGWADLHLNHATGLWSVVTDVSSGADGAIYTGASVETMFVLSGITESTHQGELIIKFAEESDLDQAIQLGLSANDPSSYAKFDVHGAKHVELTLSDKTGGYVEIHTSNLQTVNVVGAGDAVFFGLDPDLQSFDSSKLDGSVGIGVEWDYSEAGWRNPVFTGAVDIKTGAGDDTLYLGKSTGPLTINTGGGADFILGGAGQNIITGGAGADTFVLMANGTEVGGLDTINDFNPGEDTLAFHTGDEPSWNKAVTMELSNTLVLDLGAEDYAALLGSANHIFSGETGAEVEIKFVVGTVGDNTYVFHDSTGRGSADAAVALLGSPFMTVPEPT